MDNARLNQANGRLKAAKVGVAIEARGNRLYLRATLPPKPSDDRRQPRQQRIALGVYANAAGISHAEKEARKIGALLACGAFDWGPYLPAQPTTIAEWIAQLEQDYFASRPRTGKTLTTWRSDYLRPLRRLPQSASLTGELLAAEIQRLSKPNSRSRIRYVLAATRLAAIANIDVDFRHLRGRYSPSQVDARQLPDDAAIAAAWVSIPHPAWRWAFGMLAAYGLRAHEVFLVDADGLASSPIAQLLDGKTGPREIYPFHPEWVEAWNLRSPIIPQVTWKTHSDLTQRVDKAFRRYQIPFAPKDLRHAYAGRLLSYGIPQPLAARWQGHSERVHSEIYQRWLQTDVQARAYRLAIEHPDRPQPPPSPLD